MSDDSLRPGEAFREHLMSFVRTLRAAGLGLGAGDSMRALEVAAVVGVADRDDLRRALAAALVRSPADAALFREAFRLFFEARPLAARAGTAGSHRTEADDDESGSVRLAEAMAAAGHGRERPRQSRRRELDRTASASAVEVLRRKDFAKMTRDELDTARRLLRHAVLPVEPRPTRRFVPHPHGRRPDLRATLRRSIRDGGEYRELLRRRRRRREPPVVMLCDISGSMARYTRVFLHFAHALTARQQRVETFLFGTRLTAVTRRLRDPDADRALASIGSDIADWEGGTRIARSLHVFNRDWGRRVLARGAVVMLLTDGLERAPGHTLALEMERLAKCSRRLIWLNPLLRYDGYRPLARGVRMMLPYADDLVSAHNLESLEDLVARLRRALGGQRQAA